jgi:signal transduction histidine kinase
MVNRNVKAPGGGGGAPRPCRGGSARPRVSRWEAAIALGAVAAAAAAVWLTLRADFLAHPGWLAVQKADLVLGPVLSGLYWRRRRPRSRFGPLLIAAGFLSAPYLLQSASAPWAFSVGVAWEVVIYVATLWLILAFPTGRLDGPVERVLVAAGILAVAAPFAAVVTLSPRIAPDGSISGCGSACPANALAIASEPGLAAAVVKAERIAIVVIALAAIALLVWRFARGTPARRRALAIGAPIALCFLLTQAMRQTAQLLELKSGTFHSVIQWVVVGSRAALWYGFLLAVVAAELQAGRVLRRIVGESLRRPSLRELEGMLREALGDPALRLAFWRPRRGGWVDGDGAGFAPPPASSGRVMTVVEDAGRPAVAIVHDAQLADDPELVEAAGAVAMLARDNAELEAAWNESLRQLRDSRARIAAVSDIERRTLERNLHDGAQQQLTALLVKLAMVRELLAGGSVAHARLGDLEDELGQTLEELRGLAHGLYPAPLGEVGLVGALTAVAGRSAATVDVVGDGLGRFAPEVESAVYYCCLEALQNATKHGGPATRISIGLREAGGELRFEVSDDGPGFDPEAPYDGMGLRNMHDRIDAFDGRLEIASRPGRTVVAGAVPVA